MFFSFCWFVLRFLVLFSLQIITVLNLLRTYRCYRNTYTMVRCSHSLPYRILTVMHGVCAYLLALLLFDLWQRSLAQEYGTFAAQRLLTETDLSSVTVTSYYAHHDCITCSYLQPLFSIMIVNIYLHIEIIEEGNYSKYTFHQRVKIVVQNNPRPKSVCLVFFLEKFISRSS